jgi:hypothetical protein
MIPVIGFGRASAFITGSGGKITTVEETFENTTIPVAWSGVGHTILYHSLLEKNLDYYYIDTGYFGNVKTKDFKRITKNGLNDFQLLKNRHNDRLSKLRVDTTPYQRGNKILIIPPDQKVLNCFSPNTTATMWLDNTIQQLKLHTDREIVVRERNRSRQERISTDKFTDALQNDIHAVVVWSSNCAVESVLHNIPVINVGPTATTQVSPYSIEDADNVPNLNNDLVDQWKRHLSYCQFTSDEMLSGLAWEIINQ